MSNPGQNSPLIWLRPGMHVKRWLFVLILGIVLVSLGLAYLLRHLYSDLTFPTISYWLTLQFISRPARAVLLGSFGIGLIVLAMLKINQSLLRPFLAPNQENVGERVFRHHQRRRGPRIVVMGGGTGLSTLLRGLKVHSDNITAIVSVADDGGSSGRLRQATGMPPPGDIRQCLVALSEAENLTGHLFQYRFSDEYGLAGHNFGNLFIAAMAEITGSFEQGVVESSRVLAVRGRVIPSTLKDVTLAADVRVESETNGYGWQRVVGESAIPAARSRIERVYLEPESVPAYPEAIKAILQADFIVAGPGSLFTSVLPNVLVPSVAAAIRASTARKLYICNVATQPGETEDFDVEDHVRALQRHVGNLFPEVLANDRIIASTGEQAHLKPVALPPQSPTDYTLLTADVIDEARPWRHDSAKLAKVILDIYAEPVV
ncbi:MAG: YvcK family protein [Anaerolineae bacterium]|nr:YvcK family protein [Anaerolineae bacterium]MCB9129683.1 YvcK family protein [Anaerolineales bacterium]MCB0230630.1 YvcK family protein [Anaerolineae bacterium]MCB0244750.1 YvcK family protein [Anaerolineae bacterium]MCB0247894.1 YvcK family protein [Anaerolineae bacterium]